MTILYHHRTLMDGAEGIHIREMIRAFESLGHTVVTCSPGAGNGRASGVSAWLRKWLPAAGFELATLAYNMPERRTSRRTLEQVRPAFVYKRHALNDLAVLEEARRAGVPSVLELNALYSSASLGRFEPLRFQRLARRTERRALQLADVVVAVSSPLAQMASEMASDGRAVIVLPNGVDPARFRPEISGLSVRTRFGIPDNATVVGWCGIMRPWHRLELLLDAVKATGQFLLLVGDGPAQESIERHARLLAIQDRVKFAGRIPESEVPGFLAAVDIGVVADDLTGYASPMKLFEYMAMGKPVVAPDLPNIREVLADGVEGLLFDPGDVESLAGRLAALDVAALRHQFGAAGRRRVEGDRNWESNARQVLKSLGLRASAGA